MISDFKHLVSTLYEEWRDCLMQSLNPSERTFFESICFRTATNADLKQSLSKLSYFLCRKFDRKVIVLVDEYEGPNNCAFEHGYVGQVRSLYPTMTVNVKVKQFRPMGFSAEAYFLIS
jgi:hypothetical protein